jgi:pre-mRNA-splicing helicase BRR2
MAEKNLRNNDRFSYAATSNLVINQKRSRRSNNEPETTGEAISLRGSTNLKLGDRARSKDGSSQLDNLRRARDLARQKLERNVGNGGLLSNLTGMKKKRKAYHSVNGNSKTATYMTTTSSSSSTASSVATYKPRTVETKQAYEDLLAFISTLLPEGTSENLLHEFSEQALVVLKSDDYINRRQLELAELFNVKELNVDHYNTLTSLSRKMIDFDLNEEDVIQNQRDHGVSLFLSRGGEMDEDEDEDEDENGGSGSSKSNMMYEVQESSSDDDDPLGGDSDDDDDDDVMNVESDGNGGMSETSTATTGPITTLDLNVRDVDAYWLQRELSNFYKDANASQSMEVSLFLFARSCLLKKKKIYRIFNFNFLVCFFLPTIFLKYRDKY